MDLLSKGLSFCPTSKYNEFDLFLDLNKFIHKFALTRHFNLKPDTEHKIFESDIMSTYSNQTMNEIPSTSYAQCTINIDSISTITPSTFNATTNINSE